MLIKRQFLCIYEVGKDENNAILWKGSGSRHHSMWVQEKKKIREMFKNSWTVSTVYHTEKIEKGEMVK